MPNRLASETSPYLLQHQNNPVDWYPWSREAFDRARLENKPVFLSVGYSSCHWCHVMEHESFEDEEVARWLNQYFISVKVDREERPDVDDAYMTAVQLMTGRGGWPMTVFLTPDKRPFFAGTYFPKDDRGRYPGFLSILQSIAQMWRSRPQEIEKSAAEFAGALTQTIGRTIGPMTSTMDRTTIEAAVQALHADFDHEFGGFGQAPKFPPHSALRFLLGFAEAGWKTGWEPQALEMALETLRAIAFGGIHDHVGGGFHRYSTDERWLLPHFEKMLYDNAQLLEAFAAGSRLAFAAGEEFPNADRYVALFNRTAMRIVEWLRREMTSDDGLFYSALDADSEGEEGKFYVWSLMELQAGLGPLYEDVVTGFGATAEGNFLDEATHERTGMNILHLRDWPQDYSRHLARLLEVREERVRPGLDDKALASWNGMMIAALAAVGETDLAERCFDRWIAAEAEHGELPHVIARGRMTGPAYLDDYAHMAEAAMALYRATEIGAYRGEAERLAEEAIARFYDAESGGFFMTSEAHERLFGRSKPATDSAVPSPNAIMLGVLLDLGDRERVEQSLRAFLGWMQRLPTGTEALHAVLLRYLAQPAATSGDLVPAETPVTAVVEPVAPISNHVDVRLASRELVAGPDGWAEGTIVLDVPSHLHLNTHQPPARWLVATEAKLAPLTAEFRYPVGANDRYEGRVEIPFRVRAEGRASEFELRIRFQACTERECLLAEERVIDGVVLGG